MRYIDLTHTLDSSAPNFPGDQRLTLTQYKILARDHYNAFLLRTGLHTGTHIDIPMHLVEDIRTAADFPLDRFAGRGLMLDCRGQETLQMRPEYRELDFDGAAVLIYTAFDEKYRDADYFTHYPAVSPELGGFLLSQNIKILGFDTPAPDYPPYTLHRALLSKGVFILENLANLGELTGIENFDLLAFPLKLAAEASPVRAAAIVY